MCGQLLRSTSNLWSKLFAILQGITNILSNKNNISNNDNNDNNNNNNNSDDNNNDNEVHSFHFSMCTSILLYYLFQTTFNTEYLKLNELELFYTLSSLKKSITEAKDNENDVKNNKKKSKSKKKGKKETKINKNNKIEQIMDKIYNLIPQFIYIYNNKTTEIIHALILPTLVNVLNFNEESRNKIRTKGILNNTIHLLKYILNYYFNNELSESINNTFVCNQICSLLRLLEETTFMNIENQTQIVSNTNFIENSLINTCSFIINNNDNDNNSKYEIIIQILKLFINVSNQNEKGEIEMGKYLEIYLNLIEKVTTAETDQLNEKQTNDIVSFVTVLLLNIMENNEINRQKLKQIKSKNNKEGIEILITIYNKLFRKMDKEHLLKLKQEQQVTMYYAAMLLGLLTREVSFQQNIKSFLPSNKFSDLIEIIEYFMKLQTENHIMYDQAHKSCTQIINFVKSIDEKNK